MQITPTTAPHYNARHARCRMQQRSIPQAVVDWLLAFGESRPSGDGSESYYFTKRSWRRVECYAGTAAKHLEHWRNTYVILSPDGVVITAAWRN